MNDRFRFRAWMVEEEQYAYDVESTWDDIEACFGDLIDNPKYIVEQCTGLKDKNGNLIYEGDIIKDKGDIQYQIMWKDATFLAIAMNEFNYMPDCLLVQQWLNTWKVEIIGNIHIHEQKG